MCPHKPGLQCEASSRIIIDGRCQHCCPYAASAYTSLHDPFGRQVGYRIEILAPKAAIL